MGKGYFLCIVVDLGVVIMCPVPTYLGKISTDLRKIRANIQLRGKNRLAVFFSDSDLHGHFFPVSCYLPNLESEMPFFINMPGATTKTI